MSNIDIVSHALVGFDVAIGEMSRNTEPLARPDYVTHRDDVGKVGKLTSEAVAIEYEAAAKEIEKMGADLIRMQQELEREIEGYHVALDEIKTLAERYRQCGKAAFERIQQASVTVQTVRDACTDMRAKINPLPETAAPE